MTIRHLSPDEFATYLIGDAMRRKMAGELGGALGYEHDLLRRWIGQNLTASELAHVAAILPADQIGDIEPIAGDEPNRPH